MFNKFMPVRVGMGTHQRQGFPFGKMMGMMTVIVTMTVFVFNSDMSMLVFMFFTQKQGRPEDHHGQHNNK